MDCKHLLLLQKSNLELLAKEHPDTQNITVAQSRIQRVADLIRDLTLLMRLESMKLKFKEEPLNFSELVTETIDYFSPIAESEGIVLKSNIEKRIYIKGDTFHLRVLLLNLLSNARKYMGDSKTREIYIALRISGEEVSLSVRDTGMGIAEKNLSRIFTRLYRTKEVEHSNIEGFGLGLSICKKICEMHDARIDVKSENHKGTEFIINLKRITM